MPTITPHLWFDNQSEAAAELYCSIFPDSRILSTRRYENTGPDSDQTVTSVEFEVAGQRVIALDGGPNFKLDEAFSFFVLCDTRPRWTSTGRSSPRTAARRDRAAG